MNLGTVRARGSRWRKRTSNATSKFLSTPSGRLKEINIEDTYWIVKAFLRAGSTPRPAALREHFYLIKQHGFVPCEGIVATTWTALSASLHSHGQDYAVDDGYVHHSK